MAMMMFVQNVLSLSFCSRRASTNGMPGSNTEDVSNEVYMKDVHSEASYDNEDDSKSTEDTSGPEQLADDSSDGSDTDDYDLMPNSDASSAESDSDSQPCTAARCRDFTAQRRQFSRRRAAARLRVSAPSAVTVQQQSVDQSGPHVRKSIRSVINALDDWLESNAAEDSSQQCGSGDPQAEMIDVLQAALAGLSPEDAAIMKSLLDSKLACQ